jgi:leader peptidase (prepilin peptidase)/N-methyltransferase
VIEIPAALAPLAAAWCAALGAVVGSFLNVVIARVPAGESIVYPGSRCPRCRTSIRWYDKLPILSWLVLGGRCRACGGRISFRYPFVEALGAAAALAAYARHGLTGAAAAELAFAAALIALAFIDIDTWLLPNAITWPLIASGVALGALGVTPAGSLRSAAYGAGIGFAAFALVAFVGEKVFRKEALGFGDVWLLAALGAWLGPKALLPVTLLGSLQGAVVGIVLIALGKGEPGPPPPSPSPHGRPQTLSETDTGCGTGSGFGSGNGDGHGYGSGNGNGTGRGNAAAPPPTTSLLPPEEDVWVPPKHAVPFGPFLVAGALEWLWLGALLARAIPALETFR